MTHLNRREFLGTAGAAVAAAQTRGGTVMVGAHPWVYAAQLPRNDITPVLDTIFADLSYAGIEGIELMHTALRPEDAVERIGALSRKYSLPVMGSSFEGALWDRHRHAEVWNDAETVIPRLAKLGGTRLGTSVGDARRQKTPEELDLQAGFLRRMMRLCADNGVTLNLHNHIYEVANDEYDLRGTLERIPEAKLGPDLDWLRGAGVDPLDFIRRRGKQIVFAHLRDRKADGVWSEAMGEGNTDFAAIGRALHALSFSGALAIELAHPAGFKLTRPLRESLKMSRDYVRRVMGY